MSVLRPIWLNLAILAALGLQVDAVFGQVFNGLQKQAGTSRSTKGPHYFTIMGHIGRPDCYETMVSSPSLVDFVEIAGGLKPTAAGSIRIIRGGRTVQSTFFSKKSLIRLTPGDIVVVDGKVNQGRIILRGNQKPIDDGAAEVSLAITGLRDYPVVLTIPAERATIRWLTRHLGLDSEVANYGNSITQRQSERVLPDTRLATGTVLAFNPAYVDQSRLPDDLPVAVKPGRPNNTQTQPTQPTGPVPQIPQTAGPKNQFSAAPGRARVPTIGVTPPAVAPQRDNLDLTPGEQAFVKQMLTDPASVSLDEPTPEPSGQAFVAQQPASVQPSSTSTSDTNGTGSPPSSTGYPGQASVSDSPRQTTQSLPVSTPAPAGERVDEPAVTVFSPEATRPYQSEPSAPETLKPFGSSRNVLEDPQPEPRPAADSVQTEAGGTGNGQGDLSLAMQAATTAITATATSSDQPTTTSNHKKPPPSSSTPMANGPSPTSPLTPVMPVQPATELPTRAGSALTNPATMTTMLSSDVSRLLPPPPGGPNWPIISICVVGIFGAITAGFLIYSIAHEDPAPRISQIDTTGRYWLDRMIENNIPIDEETVDYPHNTQLFGKPAHIQRVDAVHQTVPRPHFSAPGGKSGVLSETPMMPDAPTPENSDENGTRIVKVHSSRLLRKQSAAAGPMPHSVETAAHRPDATSGHSRFTETAVFGDTAQPADQSPSTVNLSDSESSVVPVQKSVRQFRVDDGHRTDKNEARTTGRPTPRRKAVTVQPSPFVVQGANLLDRILSSVEHEQTIARPKADASSRNKRQSDKRGNS